MSESMFSKPQDEHRKLERLLGTWRFEDELKPEPDQPPEKYVAIVTTRSLGGLWVELETKGKSPKGDDWISVMTLGFDPRLGKYVGNFIASNMANLWVYNGSFADEGWRLVLDTEGPRFDGSGTMKYQDIVEFVDDDHWVLSAQTLDDAGNWKQFMTAHYNRVS